jgi:hypothetical protein
LTSYKYLYLTSYTYNNSQFLFKIPVQLAHSILQKKKSTLKTPHLATFRSKLEVQPQECTQLGEHLSLLGWEDRIKANLMFSGEIENLKMMIGIVNKLGCLTFPMLFTYGFPTTHKGNKSSFFHEQSVEFDRYTIPMRTAICFL